MQRLRGSRRGPRGLPPAERDERRAEQAKEGKGKKGRRTKNKSSADDAAPASTSATKSEGVGDPARPGPEARLGTATAASFRVDTILDERSISARVRPTKRNEAIEELKKLIPRAREAESGNDLSSRRTLGEIQTSTEHWLKMEAYEKAHGAWATGAQGPSRS